VKKKRLVDLDLLETVRSLPCLACGRTPSEAHHVTTRGAGGDDLAENLMPLCTWHHQEWHMGIRKMLERYPSVLYWLELAGRSDILDRVGVKPKPESISNIDM
jgi:hypothetical protein